MSPFEMLVWQQSLLEKTAKYVAKTSTEKCIKNVKLSGLIDWLEE